MVSYYGVVSNMNAAIKSTWRTLLRVIAVECDGVWIVLPAWCPRLAVYVDNQIIPENILCDVKIGKRFHAHVNLGCHDPRHLIFSDWEMV
jgi:hypothetical protein